MKNRMTIYFNSKDSKDSTRIYRSMVFLLETRIKTKIDTELNINASYLNPISNAKSLNLRILLGNMIDTVNYLDVNEYTTKLREQLNLFNQIINNK